jgi:S-adenosylmethionine hydrolase
MRLLVISILFFATSALVFGQSKALVFQSDFGLKDGAVSAMKGVAYGVSNELIMFDITHEIPVYNIWEASYRLNQSAPYWPSGTVFVSVVDPGVGSDRKSIVLKTKTGHYFVTPDNGTLTLVSETLGISEVREIDETLNRLKNSQQSYTFHGRDVYAYTGARLAAGIITFEQVGKLLGKDIVRLAYQKPVVEKEKIKGSVDVLDIQYGNVWTNIDGKTFEQLNFKAGDKIHVQVLHNNNLIYEGDMIYGKTFSDVPVGKPVAYLNSLLNFSFGINRGNFAAQYKISSGPEWIVNITRGN